MDEKKIAVILWVKDEEYVKNQRMYLSALNIPEGYAVDIVEIRQAECRTAAYEEGRRNSDAKYKVYLDEEAVIADEKFLQRILQVFTDNALIGLIGLVGTEKIPTSGVCAWARKRVGKVIDFAGEVFEQGTISEEYSQVMAIDGFLMATQYDVPWRTDLFRTDVFWDTAQSIEYQKAGYKIAVLKQDDYSCIYNWSKKALYDVESQQKFLDEYSTDIYPLVSVVITTHNRPVFFKEALDSVLNQTYRNLEIFITDDSDNTETKELMEGYLEKDSRIIYEYHPGFDICDNWTCGQNYNNPRAVYLNWIMDDDKLLPHKISEMVDCYEQNDGIALVTSYRDLIDEDGNVIHNPDWKPFSAETARADGDSAGKQLLFTSGNYIGELTTVLLKKEYLLNGKLGFSGKEGKYMIGDYSTWLGCLQHGDLYYIAEPLSQFRMHPGQDQRNPETTLICTIGMGIEIKYAWENKIFLETPEDLERAVLGWLLLMVDAMRRVRAFKEFDSPEIENLKKFAVELLMLR